MPETYQPDSPEQLAEIIQWANANSHPLEITGSGTKAHLGRPVMADHQVSLSRFNGIKDYQPLELVMIAGAGTPLADINKVLDEHQQMLAFEPPYYRMNNPENTEVGGTLGGILACNLSGPRRFFAGAARDHLLGFQAVSGRGECFKAGGPVVKNVTGFDLSKLMTGSWGTLAVLNEVTLKVLPRPEKTRTLLIHNTPTTAALTIITAAVQSAHSVSGAACLPGSVAAHSRVSRIADGHDTGVVCLRLEGPEPSVIYRLEALKILAAKLHPQAEFDQLHSTNSLKFWAEVADLFLIQSQAAADESQHLWRLSLPPSNAENVLSKLLVLGVQDWQLDQAGGSLWVKAPETVAATRLRQVLNSCGGHATLWEAPASVRKQSEIFQPQGPALAALSQRVKTSFDPNGVLNPGRMYRGM
ncbi:MAG TPA: glycolate oxidase subunit GlcE [Porticoccaceae bacterium]|nr:glycolate oxidase subunit GlcE [Porticoccaceae bacterium]